MPTVDHLHFNGLRAMFTIPSRSPSTTATINGRPISVGPGETLLQAAQRQGVSIPYSCRVGGCGTCRCRLVSGQVKELTETGYILSARELAEGAILACQSVPQTDVAIEVAPAAEPILRSRSGRVVGQRRLTHDITALDVQLDQGLPYRAGQYARLSIGALPGVARNYSFATPVQPDSRVTFFVRKVPHGVFSTFVNQQDVVGQPVQVEGPLGDFRLVNEDAPALFVAGGSGLAPLLAMLQDAVDSGADGQPAVLLFGARTQRDLYALEQIDAIARRWRGGLRFVPVLSAADDDSGWHGARGLVTAHIAAELRPGTRAYLCGPPAMIDAAAARLEQHGVGRERVHADRFTTAPPADAGKAVGATAPVVEVLPIATGTAGALDYLKFFLFHAVGLLAAAALVAGGPAIAAGLMAILAFYVLGDAVCGDDTSVPQYRHPGILTAQLWGALPLLALIVFAALWGVSPGDPLGFGAWVTHWTGVDVLASKAAAGIGHHVASVVLTGLMIGIVGTVTGHELTHRTWDRVSLTIGRWLLAFSFDTVFSIEHVYGHHRYVATEQDPATAPRGRNVYAHIVISTVRGNLSAWKIERERLRRRGHATVSWHNAVLRGHLMSAALVVLAWAVGGWTAALCFTLAALLGKAMLEMVNYMEHYGIVRNPATQVQPRHSWNTNRRISSWSLFNLNRHSHHHAQGEVPYQDLKPFPDAPLMINGYLTTMLITLVPPLWHRLMTPRVLEWDRRYASAEERELAAQANRRSGLAQLREAVPAAA
jgi:NAD(P)H-flavin reductase/ferredoxin